MMMIIIHNDKYNNIAWHRWIGWISASHLCMDLYESHGDFVYWWLSGWWFEPLWKISIRWDDYSENMEVITDYPMGQRWIDGWIDIDTDTYRWITSGNLLQFATENSHRNSGFTPETWPRR